MTSTMLRRILHLSDVHAGASGEDQFGVDAMAALDRTLESVSDVEDLGLVVVSGDIADDGSPQGLRLAHERISRFAWARGASLTYCVGNHDSRTAYERVLGTGHFNGAGLDVGRILTTEGDLASVSTAAGLRVISLDSLVPGEVHGHISSGQLGALAAELGRPAPDGTLVVLHHPPVAPAGSHFFARAGLRQPEALMDVLRRFDVSAVLCGHFHVPATALVDNIPILLAPAVIWRIDGASSPGVLRGVSGSGARLVEIDRGRIVSQVVHVPEVASQIVFELDAREVGPAEALPTATASADAPRRR